RRIDDVDRLRNAQFPEDASPIAHPIRPDSYIEMNNFYTATVYEKGAEVIRMMHTILGPENYRKGTDLYFERHDGEAVTCDDFVQCMQDASGYHLEQFRFWYSQAGTPCITAKGKFDANAKTYTLTLSQNLPDTPGQTDKQAMHIPIATGLLDKNGKDILPDTTRILHLKQDTQDFVFEDIAERPTPSILRGFSAPARLESDLADNDLLFLMAHDSDGFNRWDAGQTYLQRLIIGLTEGSPLDVPEFCAEAFGTLIADNKIDNALKAKALTLPSESYLAQLVEVVDVDALHDMRKKVATAISQAHLDALEKLYTENIDNGPYSPAPDAVGKRRLKAAALRLIQAADDAKAVALAHEQFKHATNMSDKVTALAILSDTSTNAREEAFSTFYADWKDDPLVLDKWFMLQAISDRTDAPEIVEKLSSHPDFTYKNPNRLRALFGAFGAGNQKWFHRKDGAGYKLLADTIIKVNTINPSTAARLLTPLRQWRRFDAVRKGLMEAELKRILSQKDISNDVYEIVTKSLG
ncbi:MAG: DUF3458 domain-containing protein, partial [Alphaproteobacteria bacterium]|nr:DUF3458 domain-containing protein [Alphaproteobacteria bacterium]